MLHLNILDPAECATGIIIKQQMGQKLVKEKHDELESDSTENPCHIKSVKCKTVSKREEKPTAQHTLSGTHALSGGLCKQRMLSHSQQAGSDCNDAATDRVPNSRWAY